MKPYPTKVPAGARSTRGAKNGRLRSQRQSRARIPEIFVKEEQGSGFRPIGFARAHLRNRNGYVYLTWRDGTRVRSFYLGKTSRKCPTPAAAPGPPATSAPAIGRIPPRRAKRQP